MVRGAGLELTRTIIFAANRGYALKSSREQIIKRFLDAGWRVVLLTALDKESRYLEDVGAIVEPISFNRGGISIIGDIRSIWLFLKAIYKWRPDIVHIFHAKPIIAGLCALLGTKSKFGVKVVCTITGLGNAFLAGGSTTTLAKFGFRFLLVNADRVIFQNHDDRNLFVKNGWVESAKAKLILGSGVDLSRFFPPDRSNRDFGSPIIVDLCRLIGQKGVREFAAVARELKRTYPNAKFLMAGEEELVHPDRVPVEWVRNENDIEYLGRVENVQELLSEADVFLFPSYYREGVPRVVLEASACGLPTVAFDVPGVREAIRDGQTGYLVKAHDVEALANRVLALIKDPAKRLSMGRNARKFAQEQFDIYKIHDQYYSLYKELDVDL